MTYIGGADKLFDERGDIATDRTREFLQGFLSGYASWVERFPEAGTK